VAHSIFQRLPHGSIGPGVHQAAKPVYISFEHAKRVHAGGAGDTLQFSPWPGIAHDVGAVDTLQIGDIQPPDDIVQDRVEQVVGGVW
jgi:hypothetical protein